MPFTFSHPIAVVPFMRRWSARLSVTGLLVGSMAPDFEYFLKLEPYPTISENWLGVFLFTLPLAIFTAFTFHLLVKEPLIRHLPSPYDKHFSGYIKQDFLAEVGKSSGRILLSILFGIATHLLLDWITNPTTLFFQTFLTIQKPLGLTILAWLEHFFSAFALIYLLILLSRYRNFTGPILTYTARKKWRFWAGVILFTALLLGYHYYQAQTFTGPEELVTVLVSGFMLGLVSLSSISKIRLG